MNPGLDILGLTMQDLPMLAAHWPKGFAGGSLLGTFSRGSVQDDLAAIDRILETGNCPAWRIHLIDWTCWRGHNAEPWQPRPETHRQVVGQRAQMVYEWRKKHPNVKIYISPLLEYDETNRLNVQVWVNSIRKYAPSCVPVLSASGMGARLPGQINEWHGNAVTGDIVSNDGDSLFDAPISYPSHGRVLTMGWWPACNLRSATETKFVPPSQRSLNYRVTEGDIAKAAKILRVQ